MRVEALKTTSNFTKWTAVILLEITIGICSFILPLKVVVLLLLLPPIVVILMPNFLYAYLIGIFLLPVWSITLTGQPEVPGRADLRFSDALFFIAGLGWLVQGMINKRLEIKRSYLDLYLFVFFCWVFLSILWSPTFSGGIKEFLRKLNGLFIFYVTINVIRSRRDLDFAVIVWIIAGILAASLAAHELFTGIWERVPETVITRRGGLRAGALEVTANFLGFFLNTCLMMTISQFFLTKRSRYKILLFCCIIVMIPALISTLSRSSIMGFVIGTTFLLYFIRKGVKQLVLITAVAVLLFLFISGSGYRDVLFQRYTGIVKPHEAAGYVSRTQFWSQVASRIFAEHAIVGTGAGGFLALSESYGAREVKTPHNLYIYVAAEFGLIGFLLFSGMVLSFIILAKQGLQSALSEKERCILVALLAGTFLYAFQGLAINFVLREAEFWALFGLNVAAIRIYREDKIQ